MKEAIEQSDAKILYVCNIMTKHGETNNYEVKDFVSAIEKYIGEDQINYVLVNNGYIHEDLVKKYQLEDNKTPVRIKDLVEFRGKRYKIAERDLVNEEDYIRHDPKKLAKFIHDLMDGWIK